MVIRLLNSPRKTTSQSKRAKMSMFRLVVWQPSCLYLSLFRVLGAATWIRLDGILAKFTRPSTSASHILPAPTMPIFADSRSITLAPFLREVELFFFSLESDLEATLCVESGAASTLLPVPAELKRIESQEISRSFQLVLIRPSKKIYFLHGTTDETGGAAGSGVDGAGSAGMKKQCKVGGFRISQTNRLTYHPPSKGSFLEQPHWHR